MRIFICWSRGRSQRLAEGLRDWLPRVIDGLERPFLSTEIEKGRKWFDEVSRALRESQAGLVCLTPENLGAPWIHFEAGALATSVTGRLFTYLHGVSPARLTGPLAEFQSTPATRDDTLQLVRTIAGMATPAGEQPGLAERFEREWPVLETVIRELDAIAIDTAVPDFAELFRHKTFTEPMRRCRDHSWGKRYERLARVDARLKQAEQDVSALGLEHLKWLYGELRRQIDRYIMGISLEELLTPREFPPAPDGWLDIPGHLLDACEDPRIRINQLKERLLSTSSAPVLPDAVRFQGLDTDQKKELVERVERAVEDGGTVVPGDLRRALDSFWDFDRIACYVTLEARASTAAEVRECARHVRRELDRVESRKVRSSLMPLYYAMRALACGVQRASLGAALADVRDVADDVERYVTADPKRDERKKFAVRLAQIRERIQAAQTDPT